MAVDYKRYRFTRDDYHRMAEAGVFKPDVDVELIDGEIVDLNRNRITRYLDPTPDGYASTRIYRRGESIGPLAFPDLLIPVVDVLG